ncbi:Macrolide export ATP-binding/permease protein MacB [Minicystis rosea]|nr:Macrolide export ATP-binding/permease protein MacB [Minicystis rosea]
MWGVLVAVRIALRAIARSKLRAALTILGILIGVAAVVIVVSLGTGMRDSITKRFSTLGSNIIYIWPQATQSSGAKQSTQGRMTEADAEALVKEAQSIAAVVPWNVTGAQVVVGDRNWPTQAMGTVRAYLEVRGFSIARGEMWTETDEQLKTKVVVLGETTREALFGNQDAVGQYVRIGRHAYRVIGVLAKKGNSPFGEDQDDRVLMPIGSHRARVFPMPPGRVMTLMASATSELTADRAVEQITSILRQRHRILPEAEPDFVVRNPLEIRRTLERVFDTLTVLLSGIAGIALLVGGVGVMNIMLVSVTERTREIGIRMAIGAQATDIMVQFLVEAVALCVLGGLVGISLGALVIAGLAKGLELNMTLPIPAVIAAITTSVVIGVIFGFLPARRAALLDPIVALRNE